MQYVQYKQGLEEEKFHKNSTRMPPKKARKEVATSFHQPARTFTFSLSPPTEHDNGDEIVLKLTEDGADSVWMTWLCDEDVSDYYLCSLQMFLFLMHILLPLLLQLGTAYHPDDMVILLNRGDFTFLTSDSDYYPNTPTATTLAFIDGDEKVCFYKQTEDEDKA